MENSLTFYVRVYVLQGRNENVHKLRQ